ncbi:MAG: response regulator [Alloprevotella sp.]|nr:response regulator [Alloprevotella sp.]
MKRKFLLLMLLCALTAIAKGQTLREMLASYNSAYGKTRVDVANRMMEKAVKDEVLDSLWTFTTTTPKDLLDFMVNYVTAYEAYESEKDYSLTLSLGREALAHKTSTTPKTMLSDCYYLLGDAYMQRGDMGNALQYTQLSYETDCELGDPERISFSLNSIAVIYYSAGMPLSAKDFILKCLNMERKLDNKGRLAVRLGIASEILLKTNDVEQAKKFALEALELDVAGGRKEREAIHRSQLAEVYMTEKAYAEATVQVDIAYDILRQSDNARSLAICLQQKGRLAMRNGAYADAEKYFSESLQLAREKGILYLEAHAERGLWECLRGNNSAAALSHLEAFTSLDDSLHRNINAQQFNIFKAEFDNEEQRLLHEAQMERQKLINYVILMALGLLLAIIVFLVYSLQNRQRTNRILRETEQTRARFFRNVTHEFRTPLTIIQGVSDDLRKGDPTIESPQKAGSAIYRQAESLLSLINQILDISKIRYAIGEPDWRNGDIVPTVRMIVESHLKMADAKRQKLLFHTDTSEVVMDFVPHYLTTIVQNLVSNAIHNTPQYGQVSLRITPGKRMLTLVVSDTGMGIEATDLPHVFEEFYQAKNHHTAQGSGIGLAMAKQMVEAMRGSIDVESEPGHGTTFTVRLPMRNGKGNNPPYVADTAPPELVNIPEETIKNAVMEAAPPNALKILIVEDNDEVANYIGTHLADHYDLQFAHNGAQALEMVSDVLPDLIITDVMMPEMDGYELCRRLRSAEATNHIPIIIVTARSEEAERLKGFEAGADAYLLKPFNPDELRLRVEKLLSHQSLLRAKYAFALKTGTQNRSAYNPADQKFLNDFVNLVFKQIGHGGIEVGKLASDLCMTRSQLLARIHALTGTTTIKYIQQLRLNYAKRLLDAPDNLTVQEVAERCGFVDTAHFASSFKRMYGLTPTQYRRQTPL